MPVLIRLRVGEAGKLSSAPIALVPLQDGQFFAGAELTVERPDESHLPHRAGALRMGAYSIEWRNAT